MRKRTASSAVGHQRDAQASRAAILKAALNEFSEMGYDGSRVDRIAQSAGVSKPLLYDYFGDKEELYRHVLREAYLQIRTAEQELDLLSFSPQDAVEVLVKFTIEHFHKNPWFIRLLNTENLRKGSTVQTIEDRQLIQSNLLDKVAAILTKGNETGIFLRRVKPFDLYLIIASLCYFPVSNRHTLEGVFGYEFGRESLIAHAERSAQMIVAWLKTPDA
ncbi:MULTISPECIES: TetR/AcrR family transcriptional regulator [unclassified Sinorhizobium]|uniref:TetR/AcrR family transcriptional regulator n=1 Tax=unclassified Sinorhizobium TaxID=2613772 RepID=UPI00352611C6